MTDDHPPDPAPPSPLPQEPDRYDGPAFAPPGSADDVRPPDALDGGILETAVDVIGRPVHTLRQVTAVAPVGWATVVLVVVGFLSSFGQNPGLTGRFGDVDIGRGPGTTIGFAILSAIVSPIVTAIGAGVVLLTSRLLGGDASWRSLYSGFGFANIPSVFGVVGALFALGGVGGQVLGGVLGFALAIWVIVLGVIAVREANNFSTGRAVAAVAIPIVALTILFVLFAILIAFAIGGALGGR